MAALFWKEPDLSKSSCLTISVDTDTKGLCCLCRLTSLSFRHKNKYCRCNGLSPFKRRGIEAFKRQNTHTCRGRTQDGLRYVLVLCPYESHVNTSDFLLWLKLTIAKNVSVHVEEDEPRRFQKVQLAQTANEIKRDGSSGNVRC
jgi:hypothetical protein